MPLSRFSTIEVAGACPAIAAIAPVATSATDQNLIATARTNRAVDILVSITYGPAVHRLHVTLQPKF